LTGDTPFTHLQEVICTAQPFCYLEGPPAQTDPDAGSGSGSGSGSGGTQQVFLNNPVPTDPSLPALSFPTGGGPLSQWDPGSAAWV